MLLSALQRFILRECYQYQPVGRQNPKRQIPRTMFNKFYKKSPSKTVVTDGITVSLERLIDRGLMIGYGHRTPKKWFIEEVKLTPLGRKISKQLLGQQQKLPLK